tara:strand:- start:183 stop:509 length:327 start_codon:yes stop_codon:yes gene_type:complete
MNLKAIIMKDNSGKEIEVRNYRAIFVKYLPETDFKPARVKLSEKGRFNDQQQQSKVFSSNDHIRADAINILQFNNFNIVGCACTGNEYIIFVDNWANEFIEIKNLKTI